MPGLIKAFQAKRARRGRGCPVSERDGEFAEERSRMVEIQLKERGIRDNKVLQAMRKVPRHLFVPEEMKPFAYGDEPLPIGEGQTISQPYIVAYMTEALALKGDEIVLEVGTGSGYQTAVLAEIAREIYTIELVEVLSLRAQEILQKLGYSNIQFKIGDGTLGWQEHAPFDAMMVTAAPPSVPKRLQDQLRVSGRMVIPVGSCFQELVLISREKRGFKKKKLLPVRFVPLITTH